MLVPCVVTYVVRPPRFVGMNGTHTITAAPTPSNPSSVRVFIGAPIEPVENSRRGPTCSAPVSFGSWFVRLVGNCDVGGLNRGDGLRKARHVADERGRVADGVVGPGAAVDRVAGCAADGEPDEAVLLGHALREVAVPDERHRVDRYAVVVQRVVHTRDSHTGHSLGAIAELITGVCIET